MDTTTTTAPTSLRTLALLGAREALQRTAARTASREAMAVGCPTR